MRHRRYRHGFTIVELLIVIVVIGILAVIAIVAYNGIQERARESAASNALSQAKRKILVAMNDGTLSSLPANQTEFDALGISADRVSYQYSRNAAGTDYCITATVGSTSVRATNITQPEKGSCGGHGSGGVAAITNLAVNPSAEVAGGWYSNDGGPYPVAWDTAIKRSGARSLSGSNTNGALTLLTTYSVGALNGTGVPISEGGDYTASTYFRADVPHQARVRLSYRVGSTFTTSNGAFASGVVGQWTQVSHTATVPSNADVIRIIIEITSMTAQPAGTKAWIDDTMIVRSASTFAYSDGNSPNWIWNGTPNSSTSTGPPLP